MICYLIVKDLLFSGCSLAAAVDRQEWRARSSQRAWTHRMSPSIVGTQWR